MGASARVLSAAIIVLLLASSAISVVADQHVLVIFAGQDRVAKVGLSLYLNEARIVVPDPPDPDASYSYRWDFDNRVDVDHDGTSDNDYESHERVTEWRYRKTGIYTVTLTVTDGTLVAKDTLVVTVVENYPPTLTVEEEQVASLGILSKLNATAEDIDDLPRDLVWVWNLGDGTQDDAPPPISHVYDELGKVRVTVQVSDPAGNYATAWFYVTVMDVTKPFCDAGADKTVNLNDTVLFDGARCSDNVGIKSWKWSLRHNGSLVTLEGRTSSFRFTTAGTYVVGLQVTDAGGNAAWDTMTVTVRPASADGPVEDGPREPVQRWTYTAIVIVVTLAFILAMGLVARARETAASERDVEIFYGRARLPRDRSLPR